MSRKKQIRTTKIKNKKMPMIAEWGDTCQLSRMNLLIERFSLLKCCYHPSIWGFYSSFRALLSLRVSICCVFLFLFILFQLLLTQRKLSLALFPPFKISLFQSLYKVLVIPTAEIMSCYCYKGTKSIGRYLEFFDQIELYLMYDNKYFFLSIYR